MAGRLPEPSSLSLHGDTAPFSRQRNMSGGLYSAYRPRMGEGADHRERKIVVAETDRWRANAVSPTSGRDFNASAPKNIELATLLDTGRWSGQQRLMVLLAALAIIMDGFDGQLIGYAAPILLKEWGLERSAFAPIIACGLVGMAIGSSVAGAIGDRFGRKAATVGSLLLIGCATIANGFAIGPLSLMLLRFLTGLGVGGCLPSATTLAAEFAPVRLRTYAITATIICVPVGGMLAGLFSSVVLSTLNWHALFWIGGLLPTILAVILAFAMAESPYWLASRPTHSDRLRRVMARLGRPIPEDAVIVEPGHKDAPKENVRFLAIFQQGRLVSTLCLWAAVFMTLLSVYTAFSWLPTMLTVQGLSPAVAGAGLTAYNMGGVIGGMFCAWAVASYGSRYPLILFCIGGALSAFLLRDATSGTDTNWLIGGLAVHGLFVTSVQCLLYSLTAHVYPTAIRARGTATALAVGRLGAILSAFLGAAIISKGGSSAYFMTLTVAMTGAMTALAILPRHIPPARGKVLPAA
ncbi:MFS transporter [Sphingomonas sp. NFX23]